MAVPQEAFTSSPVPRPRRKRNASRLCSLSNTLLMFIVCGTLSASMMYLNWAITARTWVQHSVSSAGNLLRESPVADQAEQIVEQLLAGEERVAMMETNAVVRGEPADMGESLTGDDRIGSDEVGGADGESRDEKAEYDMEATINSKMKVKEVDKEHYVIEDLSHKSMKLDFQSRIGGWGGEVLEPEQEIQPEPKNKSVTIHNVPVTPNCPPLPVFQRVDFTLVTQTSPLRLPNVFELCKRWHGPIIVALLLGRREKLDTSLAIEACPNLRIAKASFPKLNLAEYPINKLRNIALSLVKTSHYIMLDMDLWPSRSLYPALKKAAAGFRGSVVDPYRVPRIAMVIPVFAYDGPKAEWCGNKTGSSAECGIAESYASVVPTDLPGLKACIVKSQCHVFDKHNPSGQGTTNYRAWVTQTQMRHIKCFKSTRYEPYMVLRTCDAPLYDERFFGYGKNKIQHIYHLRFAGFSFEVFPREFLVHVPHPRSSAKANWKTVRGHKHEMDELYKRFQAQVRADFSAPKTPLCL